MTRTSQTFSIKKQMFSWFYQHPILFKRIFHLWKPFLVCSLAFQRLYHRKLYHRKPDVGWNSPCSVYKLLLLQKNAIIWCLDGWPWTEAQREEGCRKDKCFKFKYICHCRLEELCMQDLVDLKTIKVQNEGNFSSSFIGKKSDHCCRSWEFLLNISSSNFKC